MSQTLLIFCTVYNDCFHITSYECKNPIDAPPPTPPRPPITPQVTPPPTPRPVSPKIITDAPILLRLRNVLDNYYLTAIDRERILEKIWALVEEELDDAWELLDVYYPGGYVGDRRYLERQQSTQRGGTGNNNNMRRLNKTLYLPVMVTVRGRADMADMAPLLIMQAMNSNLKLMLLYLKSINADAFGSVQLSVSELDMSNIGDKEPDTAPPTPSPNSSTVQSTTDDTNTGGEKIETNNSNTNNDSNTSPGGTPFWVWIIVVLVCVALGICILCGICRSGMCLCCTDCCGGKCKRRRAKEYDSELQKQLAIERWKQEPVMRNNGNGGGGDALAGLMGVSRNGSRSHERSYEKREVRGGNRRHHSDVNPRRRSERVRRHHHDDRRHSDGRKRRSDRARSDGYIGSRVDGHASRRTSKRRSRPMVKRAKSVAEIMMEKEELGNIEEERSRVENEHNHQPVLAIPYGDPEDENPYVIPNTAMVVYEPTRNALEPEAPKIEDVVPVVSSTAIVLVEPQEPEGGVVPTTPKRKSRQRYHHDQDNMYICPNNELPKDARDKHQVPQDQRRRSRRKRSSYTDKLKDSFRRKKEDHHFSDYDVVLDTLGTESNSGSFERERKDKRRRKKKKKKSKHNHKRRSKHDDDQLSDTGYESPPSIATNNPHDEDDRHCPATQKSLMGRRLSTTGRLFASFRRSNVEMEISDNDDDDSVSR